MRQKFMSLILCSLPLIVLQAVEERTSITQYGVTWTFEKACAAGQFITGDWWVVGPVTVVSVSPEPGPVSSDATKIKKNHFGDHAIKPDRRMRNGSMIVEKHTRNHGYDSRLISYKPELSQQFPLTLKINQSLISTHSLDMPGGRNLAHPMMWASEKKNRNVLQSAAVLTCLAEAPPDDAFRPPYAGTEKPIYREKDLQWDRLQNLEPVDGRPDWKQLERYMQRPWIDHLGTWVLQRLGPADNNPIYGREHSRITGLVGLALNTKASRAEKRGALIGLVQYGIDVQGLINHGINWTAGGGHFSGRKFPLLFAGMMLDDEQMLNPPEHIRFQEDQQTYYGSGWAGQEVLFQMIDHHGPTRSYEEIHPSKWNKMDKRSEGYRLCCTGKAWISTALALRYMNGIKHWKHDAFFDYADRWMQEEDAYAANRDGRKRPKQMGSAYSGWVTTMWRRYRDQAPEQNYAGNPRKWQWSMDGAKAKRPGAWVPNPKTR